MTGDKPSILERASKKASVKQPAAKQPTKAATKTEASSGLSPTGYCVKGQYKLHDSEEGITYWPLNSGKIAGRPKKMSGWLSSQIAAGLIIEYPAIPDAE
jgi:hypothetical protein